jgi:hypothetical protein
MEVAIDEGVVEPPPRLPAATPIPYLYPGFVLYNMDRRQPYIWRSYKTKAEAAWAMADLLRPYPPRHAWRKRIRLAFYDGPRIVVGKSRRVVRGIRLLPSS